MWSWQIYGDPIELKAGERIGGVGVMQHNRRRNRLNGLVETVSSDGSMSLEVIHSFGNCPKYIQLRHVEVDKAQLATLGQAEREVLRGQAVLAPEARAFIRR